MAVQDNIWPPVLLVVGAVRVTEYDHLLEDIRQYTGTAALYRRSEERMRAFVQAALVVGVGVDLRFQAGELPPLPEMPERMQRVAYTRNAWDQTSREMLDLPLHAVQVVVMERAFYRLVDPMFGSMDGLGDHLRRWMGSDVRLVDIGNDRLMVLDRCGLIPVLTAQSADTAVPV